MQITYIEPVQDAAQRRFQLSSDDKEKYIIN